MRSRLDRLAPALHGARNLISVAGTAATIAWSAGCATTHSLPELGPTFLSSSTSREVSPSTEIQGDELASVGVMSVYDALERLRPAVMRERFGLGADPRPVSPVVYLDEQYVGDLSILRGITTDGVADVRYISAIDGYRIYGRMHPGGILLVTLH